MQFLDPKEASERLLEDPSEVFIPVIAFCKWAKISTEQFKREAAAGRLRVLGIRRGPNAYSDLCIPADNALDWMARRQMEN